MSVEMVWAGSAAMVVDMFPMELKNTSLTDLLFLMNIVPVSGIILGRRWGAIRAGAWCWEAEE